jgi:hypothetical protein
MELTNLSPAQLRKAADLKERIDGLMSELGRILDGLSQSAPSQPAARGGQRHMSAAGRARIAAAARARWAKIRATKSGGAASAAPSKSSGRRTMSAAARARIAAAARARWAKAKAAGKSKL